MVSSMDLLNYLIFRHIPLQPSDSETVADRDHYLKDNLLIPASQSVDLSIDQSFEKLNWNMLLQHNVRTVTQLTPSETQLNVIDCRKPISELLSFMAETGVHRVLVSVLTTQLDGTVNRLARLVTQSDTVAFLYQNPAIFETLECTSVKQALKLLDECRALKDFSWPTKVQSVSQKGHVISVHSSLPTLSAFKKLVTDKCEFEFTLFSNDGKLVSVLAVLDDEGHFVTGFSANDLKYFTLQDLPLLKQPLLTFLKKMRRSSLRHRTHPTEDVLEVARADLETPMSTAIERVLRRRAHHLWVVDEQQNIQGLLSLTDLIRLHQSLTVPLNATERGN